MHRAIALIAALALGLAACVSAKTVLVTENQGVGGKVEKKQRLVLRFYAGDKLAKTMLVQPNGTVTWQPGETDAEPTAVNVWVEKNGIVLPYAGSSPMAGMVDSNEFVIGPGDILNINVWKNQELSGTVPVRPDGRITLPLMGDINAAGLTPAQLKAELQAGFTRYIASPEVTVIVATVNSYKIYIQGQVAHPGAYPVTGRTTMTQAISLAGGLNQFASHTLIVLRPVAGGSERFTVDYDHILSGKRPDEVLRSGDTIVVP